jgi:predicted nuclease of predicted toxin-antitoxin system
MSEVRFYLDEHIANAVANGLRNRGIDVQTTAEVGNLGVDDETQLNYALTERRVMVSQDDDMLKLASSGIEHAGIVYCKAQIRTVKQIIKGLVLIYEVLTLDDMHNHIEFL